MYKVSDFIDRFVLVGNDNQFSLYEYKPSLLHPLAIDFEPLRTVRCFRFWFELLKGGYTVYYLTVGEVVAGHCVVTPGGRRLKVSAKEDIVLGPYFIDPQYRGKGYSKILLRLVLEYCSYPFKVAYDFIYEKNEASIGCTRSVGFEPFGRLYVSRWLRRLVITDQGDNILFKYVKPVQ